MDQTYELIVELTIQAVPVDSKTMKWATEWCKGKTNEDYTGVLVPTLRGVKLAPINESYIVKNLAGDFDVISKDKFNSKYKLAQSGVMGGS